MQRVSWHRLLLLLFMLAFLAPPAAALAQETIPPKPTHYFTDYAGVVSPATAGDLDAQLETFERDTSNEIRVVVYPKMLSTSSIDDYTVRVANAWHGGVTSKNNGTFLFVFIADKKAFIQVGYGLEGALPDATCKRIIDESLEPAFKLGNYEGGLRASVAGIMAATKDEFKGTGQTDNEQLAWEIIPWLIAIVGGFAAIGILLFILHFFGGTFYQHHVRSLTFAEHAYLFFLYMAVNIIFSGSSSSSSSSGGGSSGGGGSFGGGGAGGSW